MNSSSRENGNLNIDTKTQEMKETQTIENKAANTQKAVQKTERISGSEALVRCLLAEGVDILYGYPGGAIMPVYDELYKYQDKIHHVLTRHEQGATHSAQGYARISGKVGVAIATSGPGATNLVTGIADAQIDSTPMVCITGQVASHLLGSDAFQETDIIGISTPVTKWNHQITKASEIPEVMAKAFYIAKSGRPGPVLIDITKDAQFEEFDFVYKKCTGVRSYKPVPETDINSLKAAAELINNAKKPLVVWGQGVILSEAEEAFKAFIEKAGIPAAWTILGVSAIPTEHPLNVGMLGMHGNYAPNVLTNDCDVLIAIGMRFDDRVTGNLEKYAKQAKVIHFEIDPAEIDKNVKTDVAVLGDAKASLEAILPLIDQKSHPEWHQKFKDLYAIEYEKVIKHDLHPTKEGLTMGEVLHQINLETKGEAVIVSDVGQHQMIACRYAKFNQTKSNITSGGLGTMGFGLPAAIGAKMAAPEREVVSISGDGGYQMTIQELGTIFQQKTAVKIVVLNNDFLGMVRQWQQLFFDKRYASTEMTNPDFVAIAKGYYINARRVTKREELAEAVAEMMASKEAYFLEVCVEKEGNVFPMVPSGASVSDIRLS
jgi:acetolactate synthase-1/2/3 large subunit